MASCLHGWANGAWHKAWHMEVGGGDVIATPPTAFREVNSVPFGSRGRREDTLAAHQLWLSLTWAEGLWLQAIHLLALMDSSGVGPNWVQLPYSSPEPLSSLWSNLLLISKVAFNKKRKPFCSFSVVAYPLLILSVQQPLMPHPKAPPNLKGSFLIRVVVERKALWHVLESEPKCIFYSLCDLTLFYNNSHKW